MPFYTCLSRMSALVAVWFEKVACAVVGQVQCQQEAENYLIMMLSTQVGQLDAPKAGGSIFVLEREK